MQENNSAARKSNSELLNQLRLDEEEEKPLKGLMGILALITFVAGLSAWGLNWWLGYQASHLSVSAPAASNGKVQSTSTPNSTNAPALKNLISSTKPFEGERILDASGYITARNVATVSAQVMGLIKSVDVEEGIFVEPGQVLATIEDSQARIDLRLAKAQVVTQKASIESLEVDLAEAKRELKRIQRLEKAGDFSSEAQLSRAQTQVDSLSANIAVEKTNIAIAQLQVERSQTALNFHTVRAPFSGVVTAKNAQAGEIVSPSSAGGGFTRTGICTIVDMDSLEIQVDVNEAFIGRVKEGQRVNAVLDAYPSWNIPASVIAVIPTADRAKATVRVRIKIEQNDQKILPDMGVKVSFLEGDEK